MPAPSVPLDAIRQPALLYDASGRIVAANDLAEAVAGRPLAGFTIAEKQALIRMRYPGGGECAPADVPSARALRGELAVDVPLDVTGPDGRTVRVLATASPIRDGDTVTGALVVWQDATLRVQAEAALAESEDRFRSVLDASQDVIYRVNLRTGRFEYISPSCMAVAGYTADELMALDAEGALAMVHPDDRAAFRAAVEETNRVGQGEAVYRQRARDGEYRWLSNRMAVVKDAAGLPLYRTGNIRDITRSRRLEAELAESAARERVSGAIAAERQRLYGMLETLPTLVCLLTLDHHVAFANRKYREMFGEIEGRHCYTMNFGFDEPCPFCEAYSVLETGQPHQWECVTPAGRIVEVFNVPFTDVDGTPMVLEMDMDVTEQREAAAALREANVALDERVQERTADLEEANARLRDEMAERRRSEEALRGAERHLARAQEIAHVGSWSWEIGRDELFWSEEAYRMFGLQPQELPAPTNADFLAYVHPDDRERVAAAIHDALVGGFYDIEFRFVRKGGDVGYAHSQGAVTFANGAPVRMEGTVHDITERKRAEQALQQYAGRLATSNEELQRFAYVASHDLQEPLRSIVSFSQLLERRYKGRLDQDADEYIDFIVQGGNRMQRLIQDLLTFSRVETMAGEPVDVDAGRAVMDALVTFNGQIRETGSTVTVGPLPTVRIDPRQLEQVFANLIGNAIKYRRPDVPLEVTVSAERMGGMVEFAVRDNGIGIEPEYFDRIFEMFRRLHTHDQYDGTGIGLAVVKRIVGRYGGRIRVESVPGEGSTFLFTLPAA